MAEVSHHAPHHTECQRADAERGERAQEKVGGRVGQCEAGAEGHIGRETHGALRKKRQNRAGEEPPGNLPGAAQPGLAERRHQRVAPLTAVSEFMLLPPPFGSRRSVGAIAVMVPHPCHGVLGLVPAFGRQIQDAVSAHHQLDTAAIDRIGVVDGAVGILVENTDARRFRAAEGLHRVVVVHLALRDLLLGERHMEVMIEAAAVGRDPIEAPAHAFLERLDLGQRRARNGHHRHIARGQMREHAIRMVGHVRAAWAALLPARPEHEVLDDQLALTGEEVRERNPAAPAFEAIILLDLHPWQRPAFRAERIHLAGKAAFPPRGVPSGRRAIRTG